MGFYEWETTWRKIDEIKDYVRERINRLEEKLMAQSDEINASLDDLNAKTDEAAQRLKDILAAIKPGMTDAEVAAIKSRIQAESDRLGAWGTDPDNPLP